MRLDPPFSFDDDTAGLLYSEVIANFFRIKVVREPDTVKFQVEIKARDTSSGVSEKDHVFEAIFVVTEEKK